MRGICGFKEHLCNIHVLLTPTGIRIKKIKQIMANWYIHCCVFYG